MRTSHVRGPLVLLLVGVVALGTGCWGTSSGGSGPPTTSAIEAELDIDADDDGAPDALDPYENTPNPTDWDQDGVPNDRDATPYVADVTTTAPTGSGAPAPAPGPGSTPAGSTGCPGDRDCDRIPDVRDEYPALPGGPDQEIGGPYHPDGDRDDDGLRNIMDSEPDDRDRDGDGKLDGYDPNPDVPNDGRNEYGDESPYGDDRDDDGDGFPDP